MTAGLEDKSAVDQQSNSVAINQNDNAVMGQNDPRVTQLISFLTVISANINNIINGGRGERLQNNIRRINGVYELSTDSLSEEDTALIQAILPSDMSIYRDMIMPLNGRINNYNISFANGIISRITYSEIAPAPEFDYDSDDDPIAERVAQRLNRITNELNNAMRGRIIIIEYEESDDENDNADDELNDSSNGESSDKVDANDNADDECD
jgi:hypothetical protein